MDDNRPLSQIFAEAGYDWAQKKKAADLLDGMKSAMVAQKQLEQGGIAVNKAEQLVKASQWYVDYIADLIAAKTEENLAWVKVETIKMEFNEWQSNQANMRLEAKL